MRIRIQDPINVHMDPDPDPLIFYSDPDPEGVKFKKTTYKNKFQLNLSKWHNNTIKN